MNTNENITMLNSNIEQIENKETIKVRTAGVAYKFIKRTIDIIGSLVGIMLLIPLTIIIWLANVFSKENGPVFYTHERIGKDGKTFKLYKYRSMVVDADEKLKRYLEENEEIEREYKKYKKLKNDPRITKIGKFIRRASIDELPQMLNILKGEMSIVGPRPYLPREKEDMGEYYQAIIKCKPGLTGYWQVNGRSGTDFNERLELEKYYVENKSLKLDIKIFFKTFIAIFKKEGAI